MTENSKYLVVLKNGDIMTTSDAGEQKKSTVVTPWTPPKFEPTVDFVKSIPVEDIQLLTQNPKEAVFVSDMIKGIELTVQDIRNALMAEIPGFLDNERQSPWSHQFTFGQQMIPEALIWSTAGYAHDFKKTHIFDVDLECMDATQTDVATVLIEEKNYKPFAILVDGKPLMKMENGREIPEILALFGQDDTGRLHAWDGSFDPKYLGEYLARSYPMAKYQQAPFLFEDITDLIQKLGESNPEEMDNDDYTDCYRYPGKNVRQEIKNTLAERNQPVRKTPSPGL